MTFTIIYMCFAASRREWVCVRGRGTAFRNATVEWLSLPGSAPPPALFACVGICNLAKREITFKLNCKPNKFLRGQRGRAGWRDGGIGGGLAIFCTFEFSRSVQYYDWMVRQFEWHFRKAFSIISFWLRSYQSPPNHVGMLNSIHFAQNENDFCQLVSWLSPTQSSISGYVNILR